MKVILNTREENRKSQLKKLQEIARRKGGICISEVYKNNQTKLEWQCKFGHQWRAVPSLITRGAWCPYCSGRSGHNINQYKEFAKSKGGECLSEIYTNAYGRLKWRCANGHEWEATATSVKRGSWCPYCGFQHVTENICREILEKIFKEPFPKFRPVWLKNEKGRSMELDGLNEKLKIAFEYHGKQHYQISDFFHGNDKDVLIKQQKIDLNKRTQCILKGIRLIEIPYTITDKNLYKFIISECTRQGIKFPDHDEIFPLKLKLNYHSTNLEKLSALALSHQGKLLTKVYLGVTHNHTWQCKYGHIWEATPTNLKRGQWCPYCSHRIPFSILEIKEKAKEKGGVCLSNELKNHSSILEWRCNKGHVWKASVRSILTGHWCHICGGSNPISIEEVKLKAEERSGICLTNELIRGRRIVKLKCKEGHIWESSVMNLMNGRWCRICSYKDGKRGKKKDTIEIMQEIASERRGRCISDSYVNGRSKLKWRCEKGHEWEALPSNIKKGHWCPRCADKQHWVTRRKNNLKYPL